jgi:predicted nucleotidyltransferase
VLWEELCNLYSNLKPKLVILFGSYARGEYTNESDIDVFIVSNLLPKDPREAFAITYNLKFPKVIPTAMNTQVFLKKLNEGSTFILEVIEDGKIICGDEGFIKEVMERFREIRKRFKRSDKLWEW